MSLNTEVSYIWFTAFICCATNEAISSLAFASEGSFFFIWSHRYVSVCMYKLQALFCGTNGTSRGVEWVGLKVWVKNFNLFQLVFTKQMWNWDNFMVQLLGCRAYPSLCLESSGPEVVPTITTRIAFRSGNWITCVGTGCFVFYTRVRDSAHPVVDAIIQSTGTVWIWQTNQYLMHFIRKPDTKISSQISKKQVVIKITNNAIFRC